MNDTATTATTTSNSYTVGNPPSQYGWKCPACGAVMAPWQSSCVNCFGNQKLTVGDFPNGWWDTKPTWDFTKVTCDNINVATSKDNGTSTVSAYNINIPTTKTLSPQEKLKEALKNTGLNI